MKPIIKFITIEDEGRTVVIVPTNNGLTTLQVSLTNQRIPKVTTGIYQIADLEVEALKVFIPEGVRSLTVQYIMMHNQVRVDIFTNIETRVIFTLPYKV